MNISMNPEAQAVDILRVRNALALYQYECDDQELRVVQNTQYQDKNEYAYLNVSFFHKYGNPNSLENVKTGCEKSRLKTKIERLQHVDKVETHHDWMIV